MFYRIKNKIKKTWFNSQCQRVLRTPPIRPIDDNVVILSAVGNQDVLMYLIAIKSFYHFFKRGRIVLLVQDSCPSRNLDVLRHHVNPLRVLRDSEVELGNCPGDGAWGWERLITAVNEVKDHYVIQLDSDTVTLGEIPEVEESVTSNGSFMIGTWPNQDLEPLEHASKRVKSAESTHVQMMAEKGFDKLPGHETLRYARGQSSFAGFAKGSCSLQALQQFSEQMDKIVGHSKWGEWGSESVASNFLVANSPAASILPYPKYATYAPPQAKYERSSLIHFEGTNRFRHGFYVSKARQMIDAIGG
jgi:hypothetical protein